MTESPNLLREGSQLNPSKNTAAAIVAGILVVVAAFTVYNYFNRGADVPGDIISEQTESEATSDILTEPGASDTVVTSEDLSYFSEDIGGGTGGAGETLAWTATNYSQGDIKGSEHVVQQGDTLWEIAEARYGSGFEWTKIKDANSDSIGFLPNGSQALITPGQVLVLP